MTSPLLGLYDRMKGAMNAPNETPPPLPLPDSADMHSLTPEALMGPNPDVAEGAMRYSMQYPMGEGPIPPDLQQMFDAYRERTRGSLADPDPLDPGISLPPNPLLGAPRAPSVQEF